ncbi:MAG: transglycosylase SLT domain-containing protein [Candidatus Delongbacteria bacterium]|nr:transglycosylase SLT domain-containing protein [Candidatus Delongbacteria bacterium]
MNLIKTKKFFAVLLFAVSFMASCMKYTYREGNFVVNNRNVYRNNFSVIKADTSNTILSYKINETKIKNYIKEFKTYRYKEDVASIYADAILYACIKYDIDIDIMLSLIKYESSFNSLTINKRTGCIGATQINPAVWTEELKEAGIIEKKEDLFSLRNNIISGAYVLNHYIKKTDSLELALQKYYGTCNYASIYSNNVLGG